MKMNFTQYFHTKSTKLLECQWVFLLLILTFNIGCHIVEAQHENIPYQDVAKICETCSCLTAQDATKRSHMTLNCAIKGFNHILARWPAEFGKNHNGIDIVATFSGNSIEVLQQLPATNATVTFTCRHCGISKLQAPTFMDVHNIRRLDLSWNEINSEELSSDVFRGPYRTTHYEPIGLIELDLSHNKLTKLDRKLFEHTPNLTKLNIRNNNLSVLDAATSDALASLFNLKNLDLSSTNIKELPSTIFKTMIYLESLNLSGNKFITIPNSLQLIGKRLQVLNVAGNQISSITGENFQGVNTLKRLNISDMSTLNTIAKGTFSKLNTLEHLHCTNNKNLKQFDLESLMPCRNLTILDISSCSISTLSLNMDFSQTISVNDSNVVKLARPWGKLRIFEIYQNPWLCDCQLLQTLEYVGANHNSKDKESRCDSPYIVAGAQISNFTAKQICEMHIPRKYRVIDEDPPRFLRKRYIILTAIIASLVIGLGLIIGFVVVCIRRRLKRDDFGVEPIRYTSVRSSNLWAFSNVNANGNNNA